MDKLPGMERTSLEDYLKAQTGVDKAPWLFLRGAQCLLETLLQYSEDVQGCNRI